MPPGTLHHRHRTISTAPTSIIPPLFSSLLGQADPVTFTRHPRLTAARPAPSPAPSPSTGTLTPPCRPTGTTICPQSTIRVLPCSTAWA